MTTKQITAANVKEQIKQLYQTAFPEDKQIPWKDLVRLIGEMHLDFTAYYEGEHGIWKKSVTTSTIRLTQQSTVPSISNKRWIDVLRI